MDEEQPIERLVLYKFKNIKKKFFKKLEIILGKELQYCNQVLYFLDEEQAIEHIASLSTKQSNN